MTILLSDAQVRLLAIVSCTGLLVFLVGCAQTEPPASFERDDYFGGHGNLVKPKHHVPREVQRVEPWLPLF